MKKQVTAQDLLGEDGGIYFGKTLVLPGKYPVKEIQVHHRPHFEELVGCVIAGVYGEEFFPGIGSASVKLTEAGVMHPDPLSLLEEGVIQIGIGTGPFNEHETPDRSAIAGECGATLVAKGLRVDGERELGAVLKLALRSDLEKIGRLEYPEMLKTLYAYEHEDWVVDYGLRTVRSLILSQIDFFGGSQMEFGSKLEIGEAGEEYVAVFGGRKLRLVWVKSDDTGVAAYARSVEGKNAAIVVQERGPGCFYIPTNKRARVDMSEVVRLLRAAELRKKGVALSNGNGLWSRLDQEVCPECLEWHFDAEKTGSIFGGGSLSNKEAPRSRLTLVEVLGHVKSGLIRRPEGARDASRASQGRRPDRRPQERPVRRRDRSGASQEQHHRGAIPESGVSSTDLKRVSGAIEDLGRVFDGLSGTQR